MLELKPTIHQNSSMSQIHIIVTLHGMDTHMHCLMKMTCLSYHKRLVRGPRNLQSQCLCASHGKLLLPLVACMCEEAFTFRDLWRIFIFFDISWPFFGRNIYVFFSAPLGPPREIWWTDKIDIKECWEKMAMFNHDLVSKESSQKCQLHSIQQVLLRKHANLLDKIILHQCISRHPLCSDSGGTPNLFGQRRCYL